MQEKGKKILSWNDISEAVDKLCGWIKPEMHHLSSFHGLSRGGIIPAVMMSHRLNVPYVTEPISGTMTINDICNSGITLRDYSSTWKGVLYYKTETSCFCPNVWGVEYNEDETLVFPWENI